MKKLALFILGFALIGTGLVGPLTGAAQAVECPYTGCVDTSTTARAPERVSKGSRPAIKVKVSPASGNATVKGTVEITCSRGGTKDSVSYPYVGNSFERFAGPRLTKKGVWSCTAKFSAKRKFKASRDSFSIRATR